VLFRNTVTLGFIALLSLAALAACDNGDDASDDVATDDVAEVPATEDATADDETFDAIEDTDDTAGTSGEPEDTASEQDDVSVPEDFDGQVIEVTITDHEISMDVDEVEAGELYIIGTNEGDSEHALATRFPVQENPNIERILQPGESDVIHTFSEDPFLIYCSVDDHAEAHGMEIEVDPVD
jgi:hypothetical protein